TTNSFTSYMCVYIYIYTSGHCRRCPVRTFNSLINKFLLPSSRAKPPKPTLRRASSVATEGETSETTCKNSKPSSKNTVPPSTKLVGGQNRTRGTAIY
ncbi:hypothetical protein L9F63_008164, partial [Diploptera punctata]